MARILIVDDEESERLLQQAILERHGHETFFAADGEEALRKYQLKGVEVVITDLQMPELHGFELITVLRDFSPQPSIIAVSGTGPDQLQMANALGAKFTLRKPIDASKLIAAVEQVLAARAAQESAFTPQVASVARVLIVDDDEMARLLQRTILERAGYETVLAEDGEEALRACRGQAIDVVITDLQMPKVHGLELIGFLRDLSPRPAIIVLSGTGSDQLDMAQAMGADVTLTKPINPVTLLGAVEAAITGEA